MTNPTYTDELVREIFSTLPAGHSVVESLLADRQRLQAEVESYRPLRKGFITAESCGPDRHYVLSIKFASLNDLQQAHSALAEMRK